MQRKQIAGMGAAILLLTACGAGAETLPTPTVFVLPTGVPTEVSEVLPAQQAETEAEVAVVPVEAPAAELPPTLVPGRPTAPAEVGEYFRPDLAMHVAATGKPQLLEFFTYW